MVRLGVVLMVCGGLLFSAFFLGVAPGVTASTGPGEQEVARARLEERSRRASSTFAISAVGMLLAAVGATLVAVGRGQGGPPGDDIGRRLGRHGRHGRRDADDDGPLVVCTTCGARRPERARSCGTCGVPT